MLKRKQKVKPDPVPSIKTFDEGWKWFKKNGWEIHLFKLDERRVQVIAEQGRDYAISLKAVGSAPIEAMRKLLGKIEGNLWIPQNWKKR